MFRIIVASRAAQSTGQRPGGDFGVAGTVVVVTSVDTTVAGGVVAITVGGAVVEITGARILNVAESLTATVMPDTVTIYSSGRNDDVSTGIDHWFFPPDPALTCTVFAIPEKLPSVVFFVGAKDEDVISTWRLSPTARLVVPPIVNWSPT